MEELLQIGQTLWWVDKANKQEGVVKIVDFSGSKMKVSFIINGRSGIVWRDISIVGKKLFVKSQLSLEDQLSPDEFRSLNANKRKLEREKAHKNLVISCENCLNRKNDSCSPFSKQTCDDFRPYPDFSDDMKYWP